MEPSEKKMTIEVWSDIVCPFCYMGKRKFEAALEQFPERENIEVIWKSFQLQPGMTTDPSISAYEALARAKGISLEESMEMHAGVVSRARQVGLDYRFDIAIPANTFLAHQFLHEAREQGRQDQANELIMKAYFTEGKNVDDTSTLIRIGQEAGMDPKLTADALKSGTHAGAVENDIYEASRIGVQGVPFFLFDDKYTVRGAQDPSVFLTTLEKSYKEWKSRNEK